MGSEMRAPSSGSELNIPLEGSSATGDRRRMDSAKYDTCEGRTEQNAVSHNTEEESAEIEHSESS